MGCGTSVESSAAAAAAAGVAPQKPSSHSRVEEQHPRSRRASGIQGTEGTAAGSACSQLVKSARPTPTKEELPGAARQMLHHQGSVRDVSDPALEDEKAAAAAVAAAAAPPPWSEVEALREACMAGALDEVRQLLLSKGSPEATRRLVLAKDWCVRAEGMKEGQGAILTLQSASAQVQRGQGGSTRFTEQLAAS